MAETNQSQIGGMFDNKSGAQPAPAQQAKQSIVVVQKDVVENVLAKINELQEIGEINLPANYSASNAVRSASLMLQEVTDRNGKPALEVCTKESIANSLLDMVIQALSPAKKQCYFIVYGNKLTLLRSYLGTLAVAKRIAKIKTPVANCIYEGDAFTYAVNPETGFKKIVEHTQSLENLNVEKVKGAYAILNTEDGTSYVEIMNISQIQKAWGQGATKGNSPAHKNFTDEMAKKTVIGRACKLLIGMSDDAALYAGLDETDTDTTAEQRNEQVTSNANKKKLGEVEDAKFEEVKNVTESPRQNTPDTLSAPAHASAQPEVKSNQPTNVPY